MNHYKARQKEVDKRWHYTCCNDGRIWPVGYCAGACAGHDTAEQACEHQAQYECDNAQFHPMTIDEAFAGPNSVSVDKCRACGERTCGFASYGAGQMSVIPLCPAHCNRESLRPLIEIGESWSSY
jgi:hypothetical protein